MRTYIRTGNKGEKVLSYDEIFKKWQKSGESKTSGGVKIGIFRFVAVLLFCISTSPLLADGVNSANFKCNCITNTGFDSFDDSCSQYEGTYNSLSGNSPEQRCNAVNGCKYNDSGQSAGCTNGSSGKYTTGGNETPCDTNYPNSAAGSWDQNQCYYTTNCAGVNQHSASTDASHTCRVYYSGKVVCKNSGTQPTCGGAWGTNSHSNGICNLNQASLEGFGGNDGNLDYTYHIEETGNDAKCYSNTRNCNLFTTGPTTVPGVEGQALWDNSQGTQGKWRVYYITGNQDYRCKKTETNKQIRTFSSCGDVNCIATQVSWPIAGTMVNNATDNIAYDYIDNYFCTSCIDDENMARVPVAVSDQNCIISGRAYCSSSNAKSCICKPVPRGYYKFPNNCSWDNNTDALPNCTAACGPGQTTNGGAASAADCHYTTQTRFCDAHGCFYLSDLGWDATNHTYNWNGETSTTSGQ